MRAARYWGVGAGVLCAGVAAVLWSRTEALPRVMLDGNREVRVLHVSLGRHHDFNPEAVWKRVARKALPKQWEGFLGPEPRDEFVVKNDLLAVWISVTHPLVLDSGCAVLSDGTLVRGGKHSLRGATRVTFPCFARGERQVPLRLFFGTNAVDLTVANPRPAVSARWAGRTMPQTNQTVATQLVLQSLASRVHLLAIPNVGSSRGWIAWNITAFDPWGNWVTGTGADFNPPRVSLGLSADAQVWRIEAHATEYLSGAFVNVPGPGEHRVVPLSARARDLGVRFVLWAGPGEYRISDEFDVCTEASPQESEWTFCCSEPSALCLSDQLPTRIRLRERTDHGGRIFRNRSPMGAAPSAPFSQVFTPEFRGATTNLELEIVISLAPAEFFVEAPIIRPQVRKNLNVPF